jgi:anti-sigma regulatory factor (Ser/Thr protein kinase)
MTALLPLPAERPPFHWVTRLVADRGAAANARLRARPQLTVCSWPGNIDAAARVASHLVDNAVKHGQPFTDGKIVLRMRAHGDTDELLIEVDDALPDFPDFDQVANQIPEPRPAPPGLWWPAHYRGTVSWDRWPDADGKTVQALLPATWDGSV